MAVASVTSGPQWRRYRQGGPVLGFSILFIFAIAVWISFSAKAGIWLPASIAGVGILAAFVAWFVRQDVFIDASGGFVSQSSGFANFVDYKQRPFSDFDAVLCEVTSPEYMNQPFLDPKQTQSFRLSLRLAVGRQGIIFLSDYTIHSHVLDEANAVGELMKLPIIGAAYSQHPYL